MSTSYTPRKPHKYPTCPLSGKRRLRDRKDVRLALRAAQHSRSRAELDGLVSTSRVVRGYKCECGGWHLSSQPRATALPIRTVTA